MYHRRDPLILPWAVLFITAVTDMCSVKEIRARGRSLWTAVIVVLEQHSCLNDCIHPCHKGMSGPNVVVF
jgi:hypothetical protein